MSIDTYDFVHLVLHAMDGKIQGKTKLQKTMYFVGVITDHLDDLGYRPHFYGPYSDDVATSIGQLKSLGFVETQTTVWGFDQRGFERTRTDYVLNEDGQSVAEIKIRKYPELWKDVQNAVAVLKAAGDRDYMKLSIAAKTYFMLGKKSGHASEQELADLADKFGWTVTAEQVKEAANFLESLHLVSVTKN